MTITRETIVPPVTAQAPAAGEKVDGVTEARERLHARLEAGFAEAWIPGPEDPEIIGAFVRLSQGRTRFGSCAIVTLADPVSHEERAVWLFHTVLRNEFRRVKPQAGELVAVRWLGKIQPEGGGAAYEGYRVAVDRDGEELGWDALGPDDVELDEHGRGPADMPTSPVEDDSVPF